MRMKVLRARAALGAQDARPTLGRCAVDRKTQGGAQGARSLYVRHTCQVDPQTQNPKPPKPSRGRDTGEGK
jgi:hypothetical protein